MYQKILVALDNSPMADQVVQAALTLAKGMKGQLMFLHVLSQNAEDSPVSFAPYASSYSIDLLEKFQADWKQYQQECLDKLKGWTQKAHEAEIQAEYTLRSGEAGKIICRIAQEWEAELIVMGRRGHSTASEIFLGSVSSHVLHRCHCSIHIVQF